MTSSSTTRTKVFVSYSHKDRQYLDQLLEHLAYYQRSGLIETWSDERIAAGAQWREEISAAIASAGVAVLLISASFLASDFIAENELPPLLQAAQSENVTILPVLVRPCLYQDHPELAGFQLVNTPSTSLSHLTEPQQEDIWTKVVQAIKASLQNVVTALAAARESTAGAIPLEERYRARLLNDPNISQMQILYMTRPLDVSDIYVKVRVHEQAPISYRVELELQQPKDPAHLVQLQKRLLEQRAGAALDPVEAIRNPNQKRFVIVGDPGAGKTTLLKRLALLSARGQLADLSNLPIYVRLNEFATSGQNNLFEYILDSWEKQHGFLVTQTRPFLEQHLGEGAALLLLDALDETAIGESMEAAKQSYERITRAIMTFTTRYEQIRIVVTARKAGYRQRARLTGFTELELLDFGPQEIKQFVEKWFNHYTDRQKRELAPRLNSTLEQNPHIQALAANPLLLSLIVLVYEENFHLPDGRAHLYKDCIDTLLSKWDTQRMIRRVHAFKQEYQRQLWTEIAWHFHSQGLRVFSREDLLAIIAKFLHEVMIDTQRAEDVLADIVGDNGLLREQAHNIYGFLHLTLQEYFTAQYLLSRQALTELLRHLGDPWWEEVILLYAGESHDVSLLLEHLLSVNNPPEDIFSSKLILAGRCLAARPRLQQRQLWDEIVESLFKQLQWTGYDLTRQCFANTLAEIGRAFPEKSINQRLLAILTDEQSKYLLRIAIADALGKHGARSLAEKLLNYLLNAPERLSFTVSRSIGDAFKQLAEPTLLPRLMQIIADEATKKLVHSSIANYISRIGNASTADSLFPLLYDEQLHASQRASIGYSIGALIDTAGLAKLISIIADPQTELEISESIVWGFADNSDQAALSLLLPLLKQQELDFRIRIAIVGVLLLSERGDKAYASQIAAFIADPQFDRTIAGACAIALARHDPSAYLTEALNAVANSRTSLDTRRDIILALGVSGERNLVPELHRLYAQEQSAFIRGCITVALGMLGDVSVAPTLQEVIKHRNFGDWSRVPAPDLDLTSMAVDALIAMLPPSTLIHILVDTQVVNEIRLKLAESLGETNKTSLVPDLLKILANEVVLEEVRTAIARAIGKLGDNKETVQQLLDLWHTYRLQEALRESDLLQAIYEAMWSVCRRTGVTIIETFLGIGEFAVIER